MTESTIIIDTSFIKHLYRTAGNVDFLQTLSNQYDRVVILDRVLFELRGQSYFMDVEDWARSSPNVITAWANGEVYLRCLEQYGEAGLNDIDISGAGGRWRHSMIESVLELSNVIKQDVK